MPRPVIRWSAGTATMNGTCVGCISKGASLEGDWFAYGCLKDWMDTELGCHETEAKARRAVEAFLGVVTRLMGESEAPLRTYDTSKQWLGAMAAGALLAEMTGLSRKVARVLIRNLVRDEQHRLYWRENVVRLGQKTNRETNGEIGGQ